MAALAIFNALDRVGKTTTAVNLLSALARRGHRPLAVDLDPAAALSRVFGLDEVPAPETSYACLALGVELTDLARITPSGVIVCPAHAELARIDRVTGKGAAALSRLAAELATPALRDGITVLDCGPKLSVPTLNALIACDLLLIPVSPEPAALVSAQRLARALTALEPVVKRRLERRYLLTRIDASASGAADTERHLRAALPPEEVLSTAIREDAALADLLATGIDLSRHPTESTGAADYEALASELVAGPLPIDGAGRRAASM